MSFILEALKKSEQQRLQKDTSPQEVCKRTLSLYSRRPRRWSYWLMAGFLPLVLISGWWFYSRIEPATFATFPVVNGASRPPSSPKQLMPSEPPPVVHDVVSVPAPQPEVFSDVASPAISAKSQASTASPRIRGIMLKGKEGNAEQGMTIINEQPEAKVRENPPLYLELSKELRDRIPLLTMSMHYHSSSPGRRLVRINDRLLHEGDWLSSELHVVEITSTGAILDFQGKSFIMRSPVR